MNAWIWSWADPLGRRIYCAGNQGNLYTFDKGMGENDGRMDHIPYSSSQHNPFVCGLRADRPM